MLLISKILEFCIFINKLYYHSKIIKIKMQRTLKSIQVIGQVVKRNDYWNAVQVRVPQMKLDEFLLMVCLFYGVYNMILN